MTQIIIAPLTNRSKVSDMLLGIVAARARKLVTMSVHQRSGPKSGECFSLKRWEPKFPHVCLNAVWSKIDFKIVISGMFWKLNIKEEVKIEPGDPLHLQIEQRIWSEMDLSTSQGIVKTGVKDCKFEIFSSRV